jgi:hypothetical protein
MYGSTWQHVASCAQVRVGYRHSRSVTGMVTAQPHRPGLEPLSTCCKQGRREQAMQHAYLQQHKLTTTGSAA